MLNLLGLVAGLLFVPTLPSLPQLGVEFVLLATFLFLNRVTRPLACFLIGVVWATFAGQHLLDSQLPAEWAGKEILVQGSVVDLPQQRELGQRFLFQVDTAWQFNKSSKRGLGQGSRYRGEKIDLKAKHILLTRYEPVGIHVGQRWQWVVKLRQPRALVNEGGFDYHRWLLSEKVGATGYIRQSDLNTSIAANSTYPIQQKRAAIKKWMKQEANPEVMGPLLALAIGDNNEITGEQWQLFRQTGTGHLMAISGLHIGLVASFGFIVGRFLSSLLAASTGLIILHRFVPSFLSITLAGFYAALAGFGLPTKRALIMVVFVNLALLVNRINFPMRALVLAAMCVLLMDPLAGWDMGFWLSFGAVGVLLFYYQSRKNSNHQSKHWAKLNSFVRAQGVVFLGLCIPLFVFNTPSTLQAPLANSVVIPLVSLFTVIPLLLGIILQSVALGDPFLHFAGMSLSFALDFLKLFDHTSIANSWVPVGFARPVYLFLGAIGVAVLLCARGLPGRPLSVCCFLPLLFPTPIAKPLLRLDVLDVGQGLAIVVQTQNHVLLYDTGAALSENFNIGDAVVLPFLRHQGIQQIDTLLVSHGDNDHAGGVGPIVEGVAVNQLIVGETLPNTTIPQQPCENKSWVWDEVEFYLVSPGPSTSSNNNNLSCILYLKVGSQVILLPGDIESKVERNLVAENRIPQNLSVLIAPHHGSKTSSTEIFLRHTNPDIAVFSAAFASRYGHPHPEVVERYSRRGVETYNTADSGQISLRWDSHGKPILSERRKIAKRYWY